MFDKTNILKVEYENINMMLQYRIGYKAISEYLYTKYGVKISPTYINRLFESNRALDSYKEHKHLQYNSNIPIDKMQYFIDGKRLNNGSIADKHHDRKVLANCVLIAISDKTKVITWNIYPTKSELEQYYRDVLSKSGLLRKHEQPIYIRFDRVFNKFFKELEQLNIIPCVYPKNYYNNTKSVFNTHIERHFGNIAKTLYENMELIENLSESLRIEFLRAICEIYYNHTIKNLKILHKILKIYNAKTETITVKTN